MFSHSSDSELGFSEKLGLRGQYPSKYTMAGRRGVGSWRRWFDEGDLGESCVGSGG